MFFIFHFAMRVSMTMTVSDWLIAICKEEGVDTVFGVPGGLVSPVYSALTRSDIRVVTTKHESHAAFAAAGHALATGKPALVAVTAGPGVTNAITGVATAMTERAPVLIVGGEVPRSAFGRGALQEGSAHTFGAVGMMANITKLSTQLVRADAAAPTIRRAFATAKSGVPGPVFLSLPVDVGCASGKSSSVLGRVSVKLEPDSQGCRKAFEQLSTAERPLIIAGSGARGRDNRQALLRLAETVRAPVCTTPKGKGVFPEDHPLYLGILGFGGHESVISYLQTKPDVGIICGAGLNDFSTNAWSPLLQPTRALIHIDLDANKFGKNYAADLCLLGPLSSVINCMLADAPPPAQASALGPRLLQRQDPPRSSTGQLTTVDVMRALNEMAPRNAIFTVDMGEHLAFALHYLTVGAEADFMTCLGFGAMGSSIPVGLGFALGAQKDQRRVYVICGDGGFNLAGSELSTAVYWKAPITFVVLNDSRLNMCHFGMLDRYGHTNDFATPQIDFAAVAHACGAAGRIVNNIDDLQAALKTPGNHGPEVLDVRIDPEVRLGGSQRTSALRQFSETPE